jgi:hypothetical protein
MKKLFVIFLLVSLIPFTVGCNGLWDFDDDDDPVSTTKFTMSRILPAGTFAVRPSTAYVQDLTFYVNGITMTYLTHEVNDDGTIKVTFQAVVPTTTYNAKIRDEAGNNIYAYIMLDNNVLEATTTTISLPGRDALDKTVVTATASITLPTGTTVFKATSVEVNNTPVGTDSKNITTVNTLNPIFQLEFSEAPTNLTSANWEVTVSHVNATTGEIIKEYTLNNTDNASIFNVSALGTTRAEIKVVGVKNSVYTLEDNATYKVKLSSSNLYTGSAGSEVYMVNPGAFYFKTAATTYPNTTVQVTTPTTPLASGTGRTLTMTFSEEVKAAPEDGSIVTITKTTPTATVVAERSADSSDITLNQSTTDKKVVTLTINKEITPGDYEVAVTKGAWLDINGNSVEPIRATFTVE